MNWQKIAPEKPISAFESAMYPIEALRTYRGLLFLPWGSSVVPPAQRDGVPMLALAALAAYGVPKGTWWPNQTRPADWKSDWDGNVDGTMYTPMYFELYAVRSGVIRESTPLVGTSLVVMHLIELWEGVDSAVAPSPAPQVPPEPVTAPVTVAASNGSRWLAAGIFVLTAAAGGAWLRLRYPTVKPRRATTSE